MVLAENVIPDALTGFVGGDRYTGRAADRRATRYVRQLRRRLTADPDGTTEATHASRDASPKQPRRPVAVSLTRLLPLRIHPSPLAVPVALAVAVAVPIAIPV